MAERWLQRPEVTQAQREGKTIPPLPKGAPRRHWWAQRTDNRATEDSSQALSPNGICPAGFWTCLGLVTPLFLPIFPLRNETVYSTPCLSYQCVLEAGDLCSSFTARKQLQQAVRASGGGAKWRLEALDPESCMRGGPRGGAGK